MKGLESNVKLFSVDIFYMKMVWLFLFLSLWVTSWAYEIHITSDSKPGSVIFNASLSSNKWAYSLAPQQRGHSVADFMTVDTFEGILYISRLPECHILKKNPLQGYIVATKYSPNKFHNVVQIPLSVFVHGRDCVIGHHRNFKLRPLGYDASTIHLISTQLDQNLGQCIEKYTPVLSLKSFIPNSIEKCSLEFIIENTELFNVDLDSDVLETSKTLCFQLPYHSLKGTYKVSGKCNHTKSNADTKIPFEVLLYGNTGRDHLTEELTITLGENSLRDSLIKASNSLLKHGKRYKRAANNPPEFSKRLYVKSVPEEQNPGYIIDTITATDPDSGAEGTLTYSLKATTDGRSESLFTIDEVSGQLSTRQKLDRERIAVHSFTIYAVDGGNPPETASASLTINVDDINDHAPKFESQLYSRSIPESASIGTTVINIRADDADYGQNAQIEYSILNPTGVNEVFRIDSRQSGGIITTKGNLDRELTEFYTLRIQATDKATVTEKKTSTSTVEIRILDENDNKPKFSKNSYTVDVSEDIDPSGRPVIAEIRATDADAGDNSEITYTINGGNSDNTFSINQFNGQLSVLRPLDYEKTPHGYNLNVRAQDGGSPSKASSTNVLVRVIDVNDNTPRFYTAIYHENVLEDVKTGFSIMKINAYDADSGENGRLSYVINGAPAGMPIQIDSNTGYVTTNGKLDRESNPHYSFIVVASDHGSPKRSATATVDITIGDVNDNNPVFNPRVYEVTLSEEDTPGTPVTEVMATDNDENNRIDYSITSGDIDNTFNIISQMGSGLITLARVLNYKERNRYILTVTAKDNGGLTDTAMVYINITDANTHRPNFQDAPYNVQIDEDFQVGSTIFTVLATDDDVGVNAKISYSIDESDVITINPQSGAIILKAPLDREKNAGYTFSVTATDHGRPAKSDTTDIEIVVLDVNDNFPKFKAVEYRGKIVENSKIGASILSIEATDEDVGLNGQIRYTFDGGNNGGDDFMLEPNSGILRTATVLDRERTDTYNLIAFAVDGGSPMKSTSVPITVQVLDKNDNAPQFETNKIHMYVKENSAIGTVVDSVRATDPDEGENAVIEYNIVGGRDSKSFSLQTSQGGPATITTMIELDYEGARKEYQITLQARSKHLFSNADIVIHVQDINDNVPVMKDFTIVVNNYEGYFPTGIIGSIPAADPDVLDKLRYRIISGNQANSLHLDEDKGVLQLDVRLNSDVPYNGTMQVSVTDGINEVRATARLFVRLVTEDMLYHSITVRLNNIDTTAFLSSLYDLFVRALASIVPTTVDNIFIVNIQDDTDVKEKVLNVSFSARQTVLNNKDIFYSQEFLKERVYLQRVLLAKLSTLEVLPFDDNLCISEPCLNFEHCISTLKFGEAAPFIWSDTMLFRPIHPASQFVCVCPSGFAGMEQERMCDTEVNLCYSNPCANNGSCIQKEGGYTCQCGPGFAGKHCEFFMEAKKYEVCPVGVCKGNSQCTPLIRGGFRCEICPSGTGLINHELCSNCADMNERTKFCDLRTRSFKSGSFLTYPSLKKRHRFTIKLKFATRQSNALLFYNGRFNEKHDFVAMEIIDGQVQFSFSLGSEVTRVKARVEGGVNDGNWHEVTVKYLNRTALLVVGENCDTRLSLDYGNQNLNYFCAAKKTKQLDDQCDKPIELCHRLLDLTGPFQLGGVPSLPVDFQIQNRGFDGCIKDVHIDDAFLDLNNFVWNNGTKEGCSSKKIFCRQDICQNAGVCKEGWGTHVCECPPTWGGQNCSQVIDAPFKLQNNIANLLFGDRKPAVNLPWYNGIAFRTRITKGMLLQTEVGSVYVKIKIFNGLIHYVHPQKTAVLDGVRVNDGKWHYLEVRWLSSGDLHINLDYGQVKKTVPFGDWIVGQVVNKVYVGGLEQMVSSSNKPDTGFIGCVKDIRVGNGPSALLRDPKTFEAIAGCVVSNPCDDKPCPLNSECRNDWEAHTCLCKPGRIGPNCDRICDRYNPCQGGAQCLAKEDGYQCKCKIGQSGRYCEEEIQKSCPATWYGSPFCGPCNCDVRKGFNPYCKNTQGKCVCKPNHYKPEGSDTCFPCQCYEVGTKDNGKSCHPQTGQCYCKSGVVGRKCNECNSKFAEVSTLGCEVRYDECPRSFAGGVWWDRTAYESIMLQPCPKSGDYYGTVGNASRTCTKAHGWTEPDMFNCTSRLFIPLQKQDAKLSSGQLKINTYLAKELVKNLFNATNKTRHLFGKDVSIAFNLLMHILKYENSQTGLNLTHTQDRYFIQYIVSTIGRITDASYQKDWLVIQRKSAGAAALIKYLEEYINTLATNLHQVFTQPFDAVHDNIILGLDTILKENMTSVSIPKFNNKVKNPQMFDKNTKITVPVEKILSLPNSAANYKNEIMINNKPVAAVGYILMKNMGNMLPNIYDSAIRVPKGIPLTINSPVFSITIVDRNQTLAGELQAPIALKFKQLELENRTSPHCVYWKYTSSSEYKYDGEWSTKGCQLNKVPSNTDTKYVNCECNHMTSFGVVMAVYDKELPATQAIEIEIITYIGFSIALICFALAFIIFCCMRGLETNANSIHINLAFVLLVANLAYIVGINQVRPQLGCKFVAISLHYFYLSTFAWLFVEVLHLYRMITEIRNINHGSMKFYYLLGYVIPGIIVCLAVGLDTEGYGENGKFCWLETQSLLLWSFSAPVTLIVVMNIVIFILALRANCAEKKPDSDKTSSQRYALYAVFMIMPLIGVTWIFGLLSVNQDSTAFHYLFALLTLLQGVFLILGYIVFNKHTRKDIKYTVHKLQGKKDLDDSISGTRTSMLSRSALAYNHHNNSSLDGGLNRLNSVGISTTSTTSRSTTDNSKSGAYRDRYLHAGSSSNSANIPAIKEGVDGALPYGFDPTGRKKSRGSTNKGLESDSDSELSAMEHPDMELASSHSSDEDDEVAYPPWQQKPKNTMSVTSKSSGKTRPIATVLPSTSSSNKSNQPPSNVPPPQPLQNSANTMYVPPYGKVPSTPPQMPRGNITSSPRTPSQSHRTFMGGDRPPTTPPRGAQWPPAGYHPDKYQLPPSQPPMQQRNYSPASHISGSGEGGPVNPDHINLKISNMRASNDRSLNDNPYQASNSSDIVDTQNSKVHFQDDPIYDESRPPSSPRDKVIMLKHSGSITDENEPLIKDVPINDGYSNNFTETWLLSHFVEDM